MFNAISDKSSKISTPALNVRKSQPINAQTKEEKAVDRYYCHSHKSRMRIAASLIFCPNGAK
jgi:hypothetical protein